MLPILPAFLLLFAGNPAADVQATVKKFIDVFSIVEGEAADPVSSDKAFYEGAIPGMLRKLDPHSVFFGPDQFQQLKDMERSTQKGFGTVVSVLPGRVLILQTLPGTPSAHAGLAPGDEILAINGYQLSRLNTDQLIELLSYARQHPANLAVRREGNVRLLQFVLNPENMQAPSVDRAYFLHPGIGYVRIASFDGQTGKQVKDAIEKLGGAKLKGLVLDLRDNPGGDLSSALDTLGLFLKPEQLMLSVKGRSVKDQDAKVPADAKPYAFPLSVLINAKSASASEIVAGALQDHDRATIVGEPSFGKGLVESVYPLSSSTGLALTTAFYYTPSGRSIQKPLAAGQLDEATHAMQQEAKEYHTDSGRIVRGGGGIQPDQEVYPDAVSRFRLVLEASASFTNFATEYTQKHTAITEDFEVTPSLLDEFQVFLAQRSIQPTVREWSQEREWIRIRLKTEIFNQSLGVEKGDEVEARHDPQVLAALSALNAPKR